jgi:hypothetical protein
MRSPRVVWRFTGAGGAHTACSVCCLSPVLLASPASLAGRSRGFDSLRAWIPRPGCDRGPARSSRCRVVRRGGGRARWSRRHTRTTKSACQAEFAERAQKIHKVPKMAAINAKLAKETRHSRTISCTPPHTRTKGATKKASPEVRARSFVISTHSTEWSAPLGREGDPRGSPLKHPVCRGVRRVIL